MAVDANDGSGDSLGIEGIGAEEFVSALLRYASDAIAVSDRESGRFVVVSDSYCALTGYARDELIGRTSVEIGLVADDVARSAALDRADRHLGASHELRIRRKDGAIRLFEFSVQLLAGGLMLTVSRDVTDRRRAQEDQARLAAIVQSSEDAIIGCTLDLVITSWNPGAERLYGYSAEEIIGRHAEILLPPEDREEAERVTGRIAAGERVEEHLTTRLRKDGRRVSVSVTASPIFDAAGTIVGVASVARDLTERERARARFRGLLEAAPVAIIAADVHWRVALANAQAERLFGYPPGELVGRPVGNLFPEDVEAVRAGPQLAADLPPGEVVAIKLAARRRDGAEFSAEMSLTTIETDEGWLALAGVRDGTERELAAIVESSADAIIGRTLDGVITSWNRGAEEMYGWTSGEMIGRSVFALVPSDRAEELRGLLAAVAEGERVEHLETQRLRKDGSLFDVSLSVSPIRDAAGVIVGASAVARDITTTKRALDALLASEARKTAILNSALDCVISMDHQGRVVEFNPAAERVFGYSRQDVVGREMAELIIPPGVRDEHRAGLARYLATGEGPVLGERLEIEAMRADGSVFPAELAINRVDPPGPPIFTGYLRDVTERNAIRAELASAEQRRRQSERLESLGQLAGGVAHDFNNILNMISSYAGFVAEQVADDDTVRSDVEQITAAAGRAARLTRQLLLFAKRGAAEPEILDLNTVMADTAKLLSRTIGRHIELVVRPAPELPTIRAERGQVEQVLLNLAVNARDAMPAGGTLIMATRETELDEEYCRSHPDARPGHYVELAVSDTGIGMSADVIAHVFEPFFTTKPKGEGTGLGLATVYGILTEAGGSLSIESEEGNGTIFRVHFPALDVPIAPDNSPPANPTTVSRGTILVVEDEPAMMTLIARILRRNGFTVLEATNGIDALRLVAAHDLQLVLTDSVMPQVSGQHLAHELSAIRPHLPVVLMSGYTEGIPHSDQPARKSMPLIQKPFTEQALVERVNAILTPGHDTPIP